MTFRHSEGSKQKLSESQRGINNSFYGRQHSEETKKKMSDSHKGCIPWNTGIKTGLIGSMLGKHHTEETKRKYSETRKGKVNLGDKNGQWKGDNVGYIQLHDWVKQHWPESIPEYCQICNKVPWYDLANITGVYNREFENWQFQCRSCHMKFDYSTGVRSREERELSF